MMAETEGNLRGVFAETKALKKLCIENACDPDCVPMCTIADSSCSLPKTMRIDLVPAQPGSYDIVAIADG